jgi:hypothetical protein
MSGRLSKSRQQPLGPDETFSALVTRLIITNRAERATRARIGPVQSAAPDPPGDGFGEAVGGSAAEA